MPNLICPMRMKFGDTEDLDDTIGLDLYAYVFRSKEEVKDANVTFCEKNQLSQFQDSDQEFDHES